MLILKTLPEMHDQVRLPGSEQVGRIVKINHKLQTITVESNGTQRDFPWSEDLELVAWSPSRTIPSQPAGLNIEIIQRTAQMDYLEHEAARQKAEALFA